MDCARLADSCSTASRRDRRSSSIAFPTASCVGRRRLHQRARPVDHAFGLLFGCGAGRGFGHRPGGSGLASKRCVGGTRFVLGRRGIQAGRCRGCFRFHRRVAGFRRVVVLLALPFGPGACALVGFAQCGETFRVAGLVRALEQRGIRAADGFLVGGGRDAQRREQCVRHAAIRCSRDRRRDRTRCTVPVRRSLASAGLARAE